MTDPEQVVLFLDILGFANLTEKYPNHFIEEIFPEDGITATATSPAASTFAVFQRILEKELTHPVREGDVRAMIFSDCAFLVMGTAFLAAQTAVRLMQNYVVERIPVRMGIGRGTFDALRFTSDLRGTSVVTRSIFMGTGVVRAHQAESSGGKGMRIFLHPSVKGELASIKLVAPVIELKPALDHAKWELCYLFKHEHPSGHPAVLIRQWEDMSDVRLLKATKAMLDTAPQKARVQYTKTLTALRQMRRVMGRKPLRQTTKKK